MVAETSNTSWASAIPQAQGLYKPEYEKDACGVGFIVHVKGDRSHKIVSDANDVLCNMTHRGASGADIRDGDGSGILTAIPHQFFVNETSRELGITLPEEGRYAVGNLFMKDVEECQHIFEKLADALDLKILGWRQVPVDSTILGPSAKSKEPAIFQPFIMLKNSSEFDEAYFELVLHLFVVQQDHRLQGSVDYKASVLVLL
ncbi:hypothetical protein G6F42_010545 [Rhizopus arrhizus]|nr:hypothetical protein G6F42_010545 [Rhizopus arrhizus]